MHSPEFLIPFVDLRAQYRSIKASIYERIDKVLEHGQYIMGPEVRELELRLENFTSAKHCITVSSGTDALLISLMALDIQAGDEVITTPFTFAATVEMILLLGAKPILADIERDTCNIDAKKIQALITSKTRAIMPVSLYGQTADMDEINEIAGKYRLPVVEDGAQSFGATYKGRKSCNLSKIGCTSFFPSKPLGCYGDGGAIFTNDDALAQVCREIRVHGQKTRYLHTRLGLAGRMDTLQCAIVLAKLDKFNWEIERRLEIGNQYHNLLNIMDIPHSVTKEHRTHVFAQYAVFVKNRDHVQNELAKQGIPTAVHYPMPLNSQAAYKDSCLGMSTPIADQIAKNVMSLPMHPYLGKEHQLKIVESLRAAIS